MGVTRQAWQQYETAGKQVMLRTDMQERLATALGLNRQDLLRERDRLSGTEAPREGTYRDHASVYELPILGRVRASPAGPQIYDLAEPEGTIDLGWLFGPNVRSLRVAGDSMTGYVESGQLVIYDVSVWPRRGEGCVIELQNGEVYVKEYEAVSQGVLRVKQRFPEEALSFAMAEVKGVYQIRFRGG
jgi:SOS-response transcriptional repressor LexA